MTVLIKIGIATVLPALLLSGIVIAGVGVYQESASSSAGMSSIDESELLEFDDNGVIILKFYNGALGTINYSVNSFGKNMEGSLSIFGSNGTVKIGGQYLNELEYQNIDGLTIENLPKGNTANNYGKYQGSMSNHDKVYENVVEVLTRQGVIATNGYEGLKTVEVISRIYSKMKGRFHDVQGI